MTTNNSANQSSTGIQSLTSSGAFNGRTITGTANQVSISNGDGTAGNPTIALTSTIYVNISFDSGGNTLSAYATGTFTPALTGSGSNPTVGYAANGQIGNYEKIGTKVIFNARVALSSISGGSGNAQLSSLPFTSLSSTNSGSTCSVGLANVTFGASVLYYSGTVSVNSTLMLCEGTISASALLDLVVGGVSATAIFNYAGSYNI